MRTRFLGMLLALTTLVWAGASWAADGAKTTTGKAVKGGPHTSMGGMGGHAAYHGGRVFTSQAHEFETIFSPDGIRVYVYSKEKAAQSAEGLSGTATVKFKDGTSKDISLVPETPKPGQKATYFCTMHPEVVKMAPGKCPKCNMDLVPQSGLFGAVDLANASPKTVTASIHVTGLTGGETEASYTQSNTGHVRTKAHRVARPPKTEAKPKS